MATAAGADEKRARKTLVRQRDQADCGVACLASAIAYYGGAVKLERLRALSGTGEDGTTLLGLHQAARTIGLEPGAFRASLAHLREIDALCILHIVKDRQLEHYVLCYGADGEGFLIGDPAAGVHAWSPEDVEGAWQSRALLVLKTTADLVADGVQKRARRQWLWRLVREDLATLGLAAVIGVAIAVLGLSTAVFSQQLIDNVLPDKDEVKLVAGLGLLAFLLVMRDGLSYLRRSLVVRQTRDFNNRVLARFYESLLRLPQPFFFSRKTGDLVARLNDTRLLQQAVTQVIGERMIDALVFVAAVALILSYSVTLGLVALLILPLHALIAYAHHRPIVDGHRQVMAAHAANESNYIDTIRGMATIKAHRKEPHFARRTSSIFGHFHDRIFDLGRVGIRFTFWADLSNTLLQLAVLGVSAFLVLAGHLAVGVLVAVLQMTTLLVPAAARLALTNIQLQEARVAFERMYELTSLDPEPEAGRPTPGDDAQAARKEGMQALEQLEIRDLSFRFPGRSPLFEGISLRVQRGEVIALMGESGCGKTTILHVLQRFHEAENGSVTLNGTVDWSALSTAAWRGMIGVVPQHIHLFSGTLIDNICLDDTDREAMDVMAFCREYGFEEYFEQFPQGYGTLLGEDGANLSGGQRQLVALARALYARPQLLLLDEATAAMDRHMEAYVLALLDRCRPEMAVILAAHRTRSVQYCDRIYLINRGRIEQTGTPETLARGDNLFARSLAP